MCPDFNWPLHRTLRRAPACPCEGGGRPSFQTPQDVLPEPTAQQREDTTIADTFLDPLHQRLVRDAVEVALKVGIDHVGEAVLDQVIHLA